MRSRQTGARPSPDQPATDACRVVRVFSNAGDVARAAVDTLLDRARVAIASRGRFALVLSGGSTPRLMLRELAQTSARIAPWDQIHLFWGDERTVPPDHPHSNFRAVREELLSRVDLPTANVHRMHGELDPDRAAAEYEAELRAFFAVVKRKTPRFDLVFLGMGADGHTASLFPGSDALAERHRMVVSPWVKQLGVRRLTLTFPVLNRAACVVFLVTGTDKAETLRDVLTGQSREGLPAQAVHPRRGELVWLVDAAAASLLPAGAHEIRPSTT